MADVEPIEIKDRMTGTTGTFISSLSLGLCIISIYSKLPSPRFRSRSKTPMQHSPIHTPACKQILDSRSKTSGRTTQTFHIPSSTIEFGEQNSQVRVTGSSRVDSGDGRARAR